MSPPPDPGPTASQDPKGQGSIAGVEHIDGLYGYALVLAKNRADAEDLVQETYVRAIRAMGRLRDDANVKGWLFTILRNIWLNEMRQRRRTPERADVESEELAVSLSGETGTTPHDIYVRHLEQRHVRAAILELPDDAREIILLREWEELSYQEIATVLDCPVGTVMSRLARARGRLRKLLSAFFEGGLSVPAETGATHERLR